MSVSAIEGLRTPFFEQQQAEQTVIGIGVVIVLKNLAELEDEQLQILAVRQKEAKPETGRVAGSLSIIQETITVDPINGVPETPKDTLIGAMDEVIDERGVRAVGHHFHRVGYDARPEIPLLSLPGRAGGLEVVVFDGPAHYAFNPAEKQEIDGAPQWVRVGSFLDEPTARDTSLELLGYAAGKRLLTEGIRKHAVGFTEPVFPEGHQFDQVRAARSKRPDITKFRK